MPPVGVHGGNAVLHDGEPVPVAVGRGLDPAVCFWRPVRFRAVGMFPPLRLPSAATSPIRGGFILYHPSKAPLSGELAAQRPEGFSCPLALHLPEHAHGKVQPPPYTPTAKQQKQQAAQT